MDARLADVWVALRSARSEERPPTESTVEVVPGVQDREATGDGELWHATWLLARA